jgi:hypothetical protein
MRQNMACGRDAAVSTALAGVFSMKTPMHKIGRDADFVHTTVLLADGRFAMPNPVWIDRSLSLSLSLSLLV